MMKWAETTDLGLAHSTRPSGFESSLCFQVYSIEMERWAVGNGTKWLLNLSWPNWVSTAHVAWEPSALPNPLFIIHKESPQLQSPQSPGKIHALLPHTPCFYNQKSGNNILRVSMLLGNMALSYLECTVCLPTWVSLAFCIRQKDQLSCWMVSAWLTPINTAQCDGGGSIMGVRKTKSWP